MTVRHFPTAVETDAALAAARPVTTICGESWTPEADFTANPICGSCIRSLTSPPGATGR